MPAKQQEQYLSYLLRLWRASLERPQSIERQVFASLLDLFAFLERETGAGPPGPERSDAEKCQRLAACE